MTIVEIRATASHRYYMRKTKREIVDCICHLMRATGRYTEEEITFARQTRKGDVKHYLASRAMELHRELPS